MLFILIIVLLIAERASSSQNDEKGKRNFNHATSSSGFSSFLTNALGFLSKQYQSTKLKPYLRT